jgi:hypothetical protein
MVHRHGEALMRVSHDQEGHRNRESVMLDNDTDAQRLESHLRIMRIIIGAMMLGIVGFLGIAVVVVQQRAPNVNQQIILSPLAAAFFAIMLAAWWVLPNVVVKNQVPEDCHRDLDTR